MKKITKQKWVNALRSGKFEQGRGRLCIDEKYCCLGVLAKITGNLVSGPYNMAGFGKGIVKSYSILPVKNDKYAKLGLPKKDMNHLIALNDSWEYSFKKIADWIEENIETED